MKRRQKEVFHTITFATATIALVAVIAFSIAGTVISQTDIGEQEQEAYYRAQEKELLEETKAYLTELGYKNSGVTLTRVVDASGRREYTFTIHHGKIDRMSEVEREELAKDLGKRASIDENCIFFHEFLLNES